MTANHLNMLKNSNSNGFQITTNYTNTNIERRTQHYTFYTDCAYLQTNSSINCYMEFSMYKEIYFFIIYVFMEKRSSTCYIKIEDKYFRHHILVFFEAMWINKKFHKLSYCNFYSFKVCDTFWTGLIFKIIRYWFKNAIHINMEI